MRFFGHLGHYRGQLDQANIVASHLPVTGQTRKTVHNIKSWWEGVIKFYLDPAETNTHNSCDRIILQQTAASHSISTCCIKISQGNNCERQESEYFCYLVSESRTNLHFVVGIPFPYMRKTGWGLSFHRAVLNGTKLVKKISHLYMDCCSSQKNWKAWCWQWAISQAFLERNTF